MFSLSSQLVFHLNKATKSLAFQLKVFLDTDHQYTKDCKIFSKADVCIVICITSLYLQSAHLRDFIETVNFSKCIERSSVLIESVSFNIDWIINQSLFQAVINFFAQDIQQFQTLKTYFIWHNQQYSITFSSTFIDKFRIEFTEEVTITNSQNIMTASFTKAQ